MAPGLGVPLFLLLVLLLQLSWPEAAPSPDPGCPDRCGDVMIPYPFGIGPSCSRHANFTIYCNTTSTPPKAYLFSNESNVQIINITLSEGQLRIYKTIGWACYNSFGSETGNSTGWLDLGRNNVYKFSYTRNVFTAIGCYSLALMRGRGDQPYTTGCASLCQSVDNTTQGLCSGVGWCETSIPKGLNYYHVELISLVNASMVFDSNKCRFAFVAERGWYRFDQSDLKGVEFYDKNTDGVPMVLDWVAGVENCTEAGLKKSSYACRSDNSKCYDLPDVGGYRCNCSGGYEGNPYLPDGCRDINECERPDQYLCYGKCENLPGSYTCYCPKGTQDDPTTRNCKKKSFPALALALGLTLGLFLLFILGSWICWGLQKRKVLFSRQRFFEQNGGLLLKRQISSHHGATFKIYNIREIEGATNKFDRQMFLGEGGQGTVYKGNLNNRQVAIKKCKIASERQSNEFATEMLILSQINHRNVVKLLGCCLEVDVPMLVYEFISNGTLFQYIHRERYRCPISLAERLRIATEAAHALNYLHAEASPPIVHGDVKSANILLDDQFMVKISDFGASKLTPMDKAQFATLVQGTYGYLDPESLCTHQLTSKSDVYSFGVILAELLTGKMALYTDGSEKQRSLALEFVFSWKNNQLLKILDVQIADEWSMEYIYEVARLTCQCLNMKGEDRPTMKEVAMELEGIGKLMHALWEPHGINDREPLLGEQSSCSASTSTNFCSTNNNTLHIEDGR